MDEILQEHIKLNAERGMTRKEIQELLLKSGWPAKHVNKYIEKTFKHLETGILVRIHGIAKKFAENQVLEDVNFDVRAGEILGLIGMSGSGKTTLLNTLTGFLKPDRGDVLLALNKTNHSVVADPDKVKIHMGFSTQTPSFHPKLTVRENIEHFATLYGFTNAQLNKRCNALLELVGLTYARDIEASKLSGGMQKRLDIACALVHDPQILILDEPTADLDPIMRKQLWQLIKEINNKGTTIILASHFLAEIELLCHRIAILQNKKIIELGTAKELQELYSKNYEICLQTETKDYQELINALRQTELVESIKKDEEELIIQTAKPQQILSVIAKQLSNEQLQTLHITKPTLGKVFEKAVTQ